MTKKFQQRKTLGLALGSGGWRGQAHIGVIKALVTAGIKIDYIAGASVGALVGGAYCAIGDINALEKAFTEEANNKTLRKAFSDPGLKSGMFKGEKVTQIFEELVGDKKIEKLKIPFCAISSDLLTGKVIEMKDGNLALAIRASTSVPFVFEPVKYKNYRLIDGGTAVPVPVKTVKQMGADVVIAVNLYKNIFPIQAKKMSLLKAMLKTSHVMLYHLAKYSAQAADLILEPNIKEGNIYSNPFTGFVTKQDTIKVGEKITQENIDKIKDLLN